MKNPLGVGGPPPVRTKPWAALESPNYLLLWVGFIVTNVGNQALQVANLWQVYELSRSPLELGLTGLFQALPLFIFGVYGGVLADVFERRRLLIISQALRFVAVLLLALLTQLEIAEVWHVYSLTFANTVFGMLDRPARQAIIANVVPREHLFSAVSLQIASTQATRLVGPSIAGVAIAVVGLAATYYAITASVLAAVVLLLVMRVPGVQERVAGGVSFRAAGEGLRFLLSTPLLVGLIALDAGITFFGSFRPLLPIVAEEILHAGPVGLGALFAAPGVGAVIGSSAVVMMGESRRRGLLVLAGTLLYGLLVMPLGFSQSFLLSLLLAGGLGLFDAFGATVRQTSVQLATPDALRGRVTSVHQMFSMGAPSLGYVQIGVMASLVGEPAALALGGALCMVTAASVLLWWRSRGLDVLS
ncbi:MAG: MFS transporter [Chloroflexota bacterium]